MSAVMQQGVPESARDATTRLFAKELREGYRCTGRHRYNDADGNELFRVARLKHQDPGRDKVIKPMHRVGSHYVIGRGEMPANGWPLYLPPYPHVETDPVFIVEGEACADALAKLGLVAVTSGGAGSPGAADWSPLRGRSARLWRDNDAAGTKYADAVAERLRALGCTVEVVDVPALNLADKGDAVDWLLDHPDATAADVAALATAKVAVKNEADNKSACVILRRGSDVQPVAVDWLWDGWLAAGKLHLIGGAPGTGKTTIASALAATVTRGGRWPDGSRAEAGSVVIWSGEDDHADTLNPRLRAAGADMQRVHVVEGVNEAGKSYPFDPARDMDALREALRTLPDVRLIVVDPVVSAVSGDSHKNAEVRRGLQPLVELAGELRCALLGVTHFSKGTAGRDPVERITGSLAFAALARLVMVTAKQDASGDRPARSVILRAKSNIGPDGGGFAYDLQQGELEGFPGVTASGVRWGESISGSARELLAEAEAPADDEGEQRDAATWLRETLSGGELPVKDLKRHADDAGFAWRTVQRAMRQVGVDSKRGGFGQPALWKLRSRATRETVAPVAPHSERGANGATGGMEVVDI